MSEFSLLFFLLFFCPPLEFQSTVSQVEVRGSTAAKVFTQLNMSRFYTLIYPVTSYDWMNCLNYKQLQKEDNVLSLRRYLHCVVSSISQFYLLFIYSERKENVEHICWLSLLVQQCFMFRSKLENQDKKDCSQFQLLQGFEQLICLCSYYIVANVLLFTWYVLCTLACKMIMG